MTTMKIYDACVGIAPIRDGKMMIGKRSRNQGWCIAGGKLEQGETHEEAAIRELYEEFGLSANNLKYIGISTAVASIKGEDCITTPKIYITDDFEGFGSPDNYEILEVKWVDVKDILENPEAYELWEPSLATMRMFKEFGTLNEYIR